MYTYVYRQYCIVGLYLYVDLNTLLVDMRIFIKQSYRTVGLNVSYYSWVTCTYVCTYSNLFVIHCKCIPYESYMIDTHVAYQIMFIYKNIYVGIRIFIYISNLHPGLGGLFAGAQARVLMSALFGGIGFASFEACKKKLGTRCIYIFVWMSLYININTFFGVHYSTRIED